MVRPTDSNSHQLEKEVREHAGDHESAWESAGQEPGLDIWRIEQFQVKEWPKEHYGYFFDGDSYIVLHVRTRIVARASQLFISMCLAAP